MPPTRNRPTKPRAPLTRDRVLKAAVELADAEGLESLSMRKLGQAVGVEAMSLYNHIDDKDDLLDGIVDLVVAEFASPTPLSDEDWRATVNRCAVTAHTVLVKHPWVAGLSESRAQNGPGRLAYYDALLGVLMGAGFSAKSAYRANLIIDSYLYGFALQESSWQRWPDAPTDSAAELASFVDHTGDTYPHLVAVGRLAAEGQVDLRADFQVGLDAILDSLERIRDAG